MAKKRKVAPKEELSSKILKVEPKRLLLPPPEEWESDPEEDEEEDSDERVEEEAEEEDDGEEVEDSSSGEEEEDEEEEEDDGEEEEEEEDEEEDEDEDEDDDEDEDEDSKRNTIKKLLEPLGKEQLIKILKEASDANSSIVADIIKNAKLDPIQRNIFVYGLGPECSNEMLKSVFKEYGMIKEYNIVADKSTGQCKGYAFILYKKRESAMKALKQPHKKVGSRMVSCQLAATGSEPTHENRSRKLYIGNLGPNISPERLRAHFALYGEIEEGPIGVDRLTGKFRGYALIVYKTELGIQKALEEPVKLLDGCRLQCSIAMGKANVANPVVGSTPSPNVAVPGVVGPTVPPVVAVFPNFPVGLNPGSVLMGRNTDIGMVNPVLGIGTSTTQNPVGFSATFAGGASQPPSRIGNPPAVGLGTGFTLQPGMNSTSPSVMSNYGSQAAFHGLGAFQNSQLIQSSASAPLRYTSPGTGSVAAPPSYFGYR